MLYLIQNHHRNNFNKTLKSMHRKRYDVFYEDLGWDVSVKDGMESDQYDIDSAIYMISQDPEHGVVGGMRFLPTSGPNMIKDSFQHLVNSSDIIPNSSKIWEVTRFFYKKPKSKNDRIGFARKGTIELFIGMMEFAITWELEGLLVLTDLRIEKLLHNIGWKVERIGAPTEFNGQHYVVGLLSVSHELLKEIREKTSIDYPVLMSPLPICRDNIKALDLGISSDQDLLLSSSYNL